jgi:hypothetical protein
MKGSQAVAVVLMLLLLPGCALHGTPPIVHDQWTRVVAIPAGTAVRVWSDPPAMLSRGHREDGIVTEANDAGIEIAGRTGLLRFSRAEVRRVDVMMRGGDSPVNGIATGAALGGGYGLFVLWQAENDIEGLGFLPFVAAAIGGLIGGFVDALIVGQRPRTVYRVSHP